MMMSIRTHAQSLRKAGRIAGALGLILFIFIMMRQVLTNALVIVFGGAAVAFLVEPLCRIFERRLSRNLASLLALLTILGTTLLALWLLLPSLISEVIQLTEALPASVELLKGWVSRAAEWIEAHLPGIELPKPSIGSDPLPTIALKTISFAGGLADVIYRLSLMIVLGYFFLCDRDRLLIRMELLVPRSARKTAVRMGNAVGRELKLYLRGQGMIAAAVGALAAAGLALIGVRSALVLGIIIGILNMIPYFGPIIGGIPAVLMALGSGAQSALLTVAVLWLVQQIDGALISPRIMSSLTGFSPAVVLLAIFIGSGLAGIVGMLLAMPLVMTFRTVFRVFVQRYENV